MFRLRSEPGSVAEIGERRDRGTGVPVLFMGNFSIASAGFVKYN